MVFTPYHKWTHDHKIHHQTVGNLDKRGTGDVTTLTVEEYSKLSKWKKFGYRFYRNPFFLFGIAPILLFTILHRFTNKEMSGKEKLYVHLTNLALAACYYIADSGNWMENIFNDTVADTLYCHSAWCMVVLCPASVQACEMD